MNDGKQTQGSKFNLKENESSSLNNFLLKNSIQHVSTDFAQAI